MPRLPDLLIEGQNFAHMHRTPIGCLAWLGATPTRAVCRRRCPHPPAQSAPGDLSPASHLGRSVAPCRNRRHIGSSERMQCAAIRTRTRRSGSRERPRQDRRRWRGSRLRPGPDDPEVIVAGKSERPLPPPARCARRSGPSSGPRSGRAGRARGQGEGGAGGAREARGDREGDPRRRRGRRAQGRARRRYAARKARQGKR